MSEWQCRFCGVTSELTGARLRQASASHLLNNHQDELNALPGDWPALPSGDHEIRSLDDYCDGCGRLSIPCTREAACCADCTHRFEVSATREIRR